MRDRKEVTEVIDNHVSIHDIIDGKTPDEVIQVMEKYKQVWQGCKIKFAVEYYGYDGGLKFQLLETRLETDQEYTRRMKVEEKQAQKEQAARAKKEQQELKEYQRLKKKFELVDKQYRG